MSKRPMESDRERESAGLQVSDDVDHNRRWTMRGANGTSSDLLRNAGLAAQMLDHENKRDETTPSPGKRKAAYIVMAVLIIFLIAVAVLFIT